MKTSGTASKGSDTVDLPAARVDQISIRYGEMEAVTEVSLDVFPGQIVGLVGPNGSGKTSIAESVAGLRNVLVSGSITVFGHNPVRDRARIAPWLGMQLQESVFPSRTRVSELCKVYEAIYGAPGATDQLLETFGLTDRRGSLVSTLSGGMRQRLALALAQVGGVRLVILDELTSGLDPEQRRETWKAVRDLAERGVAVLLTSHYMDEVEALCDRVAVLRKGRLAAVGTPANITADFGGPTRFDINLADDHAGIAEIDALGLAVISADETCIAYAGDFPADYDRIVSLLATLGKSPSFVHYRSPSFEDAYLRLVNSEPDSEADRKAALCCVAPARPLASSSADGQPGRLRPPPPREPAGRRSRRAGLSDRPQRREIAVGALPSIVRFEALRMMRNFAPVFFALAFPVLMLCIFGGIYGNKPSSQFDGRGVVDASVPAYLVLVVAVTGLMSFPLGLAEYRSQKILKRFRATPARASNFLVAQGLVNLLLSLMGAGLLILCGALFFHLHMPHSIAGTIGALLLSALAIYVVGAVVAAVAPSERSATAIANLVYFPMIFLSGATIPLSLFPAAMKKIADVLPPTYAVKLLQHAWLTTGTDVTLDIAVLLGVAVIGSVVAGRFFRWE
ncbi:MAG: ABC transporter ATP-binding protein/permease [Frankiaceae bacterium]|jgi:ABC-type multidrug transport system ATPase subunit/ABC-type polysaccharide/polyol phosphate export permease|nr:ABC transporter ATP-binding protein/permease [Frankiaceae bacterium]